MFIKDNKYMMWLNTTEENAFNEMCKYQFANMMQSDAKIFELYAKYIYDGSSFIIRGEHELLKDIFNIENQESLSRKQTLLLGKALLSLLIDKKMKGEFIKDSEGRDVNYRVIDKYLGDNDIQFYDGTEYFEGKALPLDSDEYYDWRCSKWRKQGGLNNENTN